MSTFYSLFHYLTTHSLSVERNLDPASLTDFANPAVDHAHALAGFALRAAHEAGELVVGHRPSGENEGGENRALRVGLGNPVPAFAGMTAFDGTIQTLLNVSMASCRDAPALPAGGLQCVSTVTHRS